MTDHEKQDLDKLKASARSWCPGDLIQARTRRWKGNFRGYAGYRQRGRAEARIAKRRKTRTERRIGKMLCENSDG